MKFAQSLELALDNLEQMENMENIDRLEDWFQMYMSLTRILEIVISQNAVNKIQTVLLKRNELLKKLNDVHIDDNSTQWVEQNMKILKEVETRCQMKLKNNMDNLVGNIVKVATIGKNQKGHSNQNGYISRFVDIKS